MLSPVLRSWSILNRRQKLALSGFTLLRSLTNLLDIAAITIVAVVAAIALGNSTVPAFLRSQEYEQEQLILVLLSSASLLFLVKTALGAALARLTYRFLATIEVYYSNEVARSIFGADLSTVKNLSKGELEWAIVKSPNFAFFRVLSQASNFVAETSLAIFVFILFLVTDWKTALFVTLYFAVILIIFNKVTRRVMESAGEEYQASFVSVNQSIVDLVNAYREIFVGAKTQWFLEKLRDSRRDLAFSEATQTHLHALPRLVAEIGLILGGIGFFVTQMLIAPTGPDFYSVGIYLIGSLRMMSALLPLQRAVLSLGYDSPQAAEAQSQIESYREQNSRVELSLSTERCGDKEDDVIAPVRVEIRDVSFRFPDQTGGRAADTLKNVSLELGPGQIGAIIGPSGSGKSTIVDLLLGLYEPTSGRILCSGLTPRELREQHPGAVAYVPQKSGVISGTLRDNIALGVSPDMVDDERIWASLLSAQLDGMVQALPHGLDSELGKHGDSFSGGQLQRLGLARAFYSEPKLLVLDEATSALDPETESAVTNYILQLRGTTTVLVVAHRVSTVQNADLIFLLVDGRLEASGDFEELKLRNQLVQSYSDLAE